MVRDPNAPFFLALHSFEVDPYSGDVSLSLMATDGLRYSLTLSAGMVPALIGTIGALGKQIATAAPQLTGQWENLQALTVQSIEAIRHPNGLAGLELKTAESLPLSILFDRALLPQLRASLDALERES
jgi:hypothetical protein